jgi:integrase/recombinase XerD
VRTREAAELSGLVEGFLEALRVRGRSVSCQERAEHVLPRFLLHLEQHGVEDIRAVTEAHLVSFAGYLARVKTARGAPLSASTRSAYLGTLRSFFTWLMKRGVLLASPAEHLVIPRVRRLPRAVLSEEQARRLVTAPGPESALGKRDRAILELLYGSGIRVGELSRLDLKDVDLERGVVLVRSGKGKKDRWAPLPARAAAALDVYLRESRVDAGEMAVFVSEAGRRLIPASIRKRVRQWGQEAKIASRVTPHRLRHACATHLLRGGADVRHVQQLLGHRSVETTVIYTRVAMEDLRRLLRKHPRRRASLPRRRPGK